jgi:hypothetical protein
MPTNTVAELDTRLHDDRRSKVPDVGTAGLLSQQGVVDQKDGDQHAEFCEWVNRSNRDVRRTA